MECNILGTDYGLDLGLDVHGSAVLRVRDRERYSSGLASSMLTKSLASYNPLRIPPSLMSKIHFYLTLSPSTKILWD
jgi:hypothetical protein